MAVIPFTHSFIQQTNVKYHVPDTVLSAKEKKRLIRQGPFI